MLGPQNHADRVESGNTGASGRAQVDGFAQRAIRPQIQMWRYGKCRALNLNNLGNVVTWDHRFHDLTATTRMVQSMCIALHRMVRMMTEERRIMVRVSEDLHRAVRVKAADLGRPVSEVVRGLLRQWVDEKIETPSEEEGRLEQV